MRVRRASASTARGAGQASWREYRGGPRLRVLLREDELEGPLLNGEGHAPAARATSRTARSAVARPCVASAAAAGDVPDMGKRSTMNLLLLGAIGLPGLPLAGGFAYFFVPPR